MHGKRKNYNHASTKKKLFFDKNKNVNKASREKMCWESLNDMIHLFPMQYNNNNIIKIPDTQISKHDAKKGDDTKLFDRPQVAFSFRDLFRCE